MKINCFSGLTVSILAAALFLAGCKPDDTNAPIITLLGDNPQVIVYKSAENYTDPGYSALDAIDGPVTVTVSGIVNLNSAGAQTITYEATDGSGNTATATRTVIVDAAPYVAGIYSVIDVNTSEGTSPAYTDTISVSDTAYNVILFKRFGNLQNCSLKISFAGTTMTIPQQVVSCGSPVNAYTFTGFGEFTDSTMQINYTRVLNSTAVSGTGTYVRQ